MKIRIKKNIDILELAGIFYTFSIAFSTSTGTALVRFSRLILLGVVFLTIISSRKIKKIPINYFLWSGIFLSFSGISWFWGSSRELVFSSILTQVYIFVANWIILFILYRRVDYIFTLIKTIIWSSILHGLKIYLEHGFTAYLTTRGGTELANANILAFVTSCSIILTIIIITLNKTKFKKLYYVVGAINVIFALLTASKKIFIYVGVFMAIYFILKANNSLRLIRNLLLISIIGICTFIIIMNVDFLYDLVGYRIETMILGFIGGETDGSTSFRLNLIKWGMEWFREKPIFGYGLNCYKYLLGTTYNTCAGSSGVYAHNNYVELLVDLGVVGTLIYYSIYFSILRKSYKLNRIKSNLGKLSLAFMISLMVAEYGQVSYSIAFLQEIILIIWFLTSEFYSKDKSKES